MTRHRLSLRRVARSQGRAKVRSSIHTSAKIKRGALGRGRPRKPLRLHLLQGTLRPDQHNLNEPQVEEAIPDPPAHLEGEALAEWNRITAELSGLKIISKLDRAALAAYCFSYAQWVEACEKLKDGIVFKAPSGYPMMSPWWVICRRAIEQMRNFLTELGLLLPRERESPEPPKDRSGRMRGAACISFWRDRRKKLPSRAAENFNLQIMVHPTAGRSENRLVYLWPNLSANPVFFLG
jgi:P27 family predicted phage terminase small subunit